MAERKPTLRKSIPAAPTTPTGQRLVAEFIEGGTDHYMVNDIARDIAAIEAEARATPSSPEGGR